MTRSEALQVILNTRGRFFGVIFKKRKDGSIREMCCRLGVHKHLRHERTQRDFDGNLTQTAWDSRTNLIYVYDVGVSDYRSVPVEGIKQVKVEGEWVDVVD